uniref:Ral-GDS-related protein-like n=1 Tax=Rhinopithecus roxellana TaxID=61622 RepID=A0A2K6PFJ3_RHIRO
MLALEPAPPLLADLGSALEPESPVAMDAQGYLHSAPAPGEGPPPGTVLELQSAPESPCPCPGTVKSQHTEELPDITTFPPRLLAEQLTLMDAELFKKVELYECLGSIWGQRHQKGSELVAPTVCATIAHFNRLTNCVTTSCLRDDSMRARDRARVVEHWIKVARECLSLNNFSSVHAIVSALLSNPIHRLHKTWAGVSSKSTKCLEELCKKDTAVKRDLLIKVQWSLGNLGQGIGPGVQWLFCNGVVPFLGDFLTELHRLDSAIPDDLDGNTNKRRKEVRVLQEVQLLQVAAMNYRLRPLEKFVTCFSRMEQLSDKERLHCSVTISVHCNVCLLGSNPSSASQAAGTTAVHHYVRLFSCCCSSTSCPVSWSPNPSRLETSCSGWGPTGMLARTPALHHPSPRPETPGNHI